MKLAIITDNTAHLPEHLAKRADIFVLDIPVIIDGKSYVEGQNLTIEAFTKA